MKYCSKCVTPDTRPNIELDSQGVCNACITHKTKKVIDWNQRKIQFKKVVANAKKKSEGYDCVIPVSGGKDSTWQVVTCLKYGLHPLAVTWKTPVRTKIGEKNLKNLIHLGVDHIDYQINPILEKKFIKKSFNHFGTPVIPMHMALFQIPLKVAVQFKIPLLVWGENSAFEYGSKDKETQGFELNERWLKKFSVTQGTTAKNWVSKEFTKKDLTPYFGPKKAELQKQKTLAVFLGHYFRWDPVQTFRVATSYGFQPEKSGPRTGFYAFADIDDDFVSIHHYFKWFKFGFTRLFDNLSIEIRNGRMKRNHAIDIIKKTGTQTPWKDIQYFCDYIGINQNEFFKIADRFRNPKVWVKKRGKWTIPGFITGKEVQNAY